METIIISCASSIIFFILGAIMFANWQNKKTMALREYYKNLYSKPEEKQPTRNSIYADHVINTASRVYCNFNESKIIRPGQAHLEDRKSRQDKALTEAFNLVNKAYAVFDNLDKEGDNVIN